jgi:molecular chaperone GrpE
MENNLDSGKNEGNKLNEENGETRRLREQAQQAQKELEEAKDQQLRALADLANLRKRIAQERHDSWENGAATMVTEILPILDNFERAIAALSQAQDIKSVKEGVIMIYNQLRTTLQKSGVEPIAAIGKQFDPYFHEAAGKVISLEAEEGSVVNEVQRGYMLKDRVLRPSRVIVAAPPEENATGNS